MGVWIQIAAVPSSTAYVLRLTLDSVNDASSDNCKIISIELVTNSISIKFAGAATLGLGNRYNYQEASLSSYTLNKWYWIYTSRSQSSGFLSQIQLVGIYDPQVSSYVVSVSDDWGLLYYMPSLSSNGFMIYVDGFKGYAEGFCGKIRGLIVMPGVSVSLSNAYEYLAQQQQGGGLSNLLLYYPFDSRTGQVAKDESGNGNDGILGSTIYPDSNDPTWETDLSQGIHFTNAGTPTYIQLPLFEFLGSDDSLTVSFNITLNSAPSCNSPIIQRLSVKNILKKSSNTVVFGIVIKGSARTLSIFFNEVELALGITLTLGQSTTITIMCTTYGGLKYPLCKAYQASTKKLPLTNVTASSLGESSSDRNLLGDPSCALDAYLGQVVISKDGNLNDVGCSSCLLSVSMDSSSSKFCLSCNPSGNLVPFNGTCLAACGTGFQRSSDGQCYCPTGYYVNGDVCSACNTTCTGCSSSGASSCYSCSPSMNPPVYLASDGTCVFTCPPGTYADTPSLYCIPCNPACIQCTAAGNTNCVPAAGCNSSYFQQPSPNTSSCLTTCPSTNYYSNSTDNTCDSCDPSCQVCTGPTNAQCSQCASGYYLLAPNTCVTASGCPQGTYPDSTTSTCANCVSPCMTCTSSTSCLTCVSNYYLQPVPNSGQCATTCQSGYYADAQSLSCISCDPGCIECTTAGNTNCIPAAGCNSGYYQQPSPYASSCLITCPSTNYYPNNDNSKCGSCDPSCQVCNGSTNAQCSQCTSGYYLSAPSTCVTASGCPQGTYLDSTTSTCASCVFPCMTCTSSTSCLTCSSLLWFYNQTCYVKCPAYTYQVYGTNGDNYCADCDPSCLTCTASGPSACTLCNSGLYLFNSQCLLECPSGTYEAKIQVSGSIQAPICANKIPLFMSLELTKDPRQVLVLFSESVGTNYLDIFRGVLQATLQNVTLDNSLVQTSNLDNATLNLTLLVDYYYPSGAQLLVNLELGSDFDTDPTNKYSFPVKYATIGLSEFYPYTQPQNSVITTTTQVTQASYTGITSAQAAVIGAQSTLLDAGSGLGLSLVQFRLITDLIQMLQFLDIDWPANVMQLFQEAYIDPSNLCLPICFFATPPKNQLPNITLSNVLLAQQISPLYLVNDCQIFSTIVIGVTITFALKIILQFKRPKYMPLRISSFGVSLDKLLAWNIMLLVFISNYPLFFGYSILQLYYSDFEMYYTSTGTVLAIISLIFCTGFAVWVMLLAKRFSIEARQDHEHAHKKYARVLSVFEGVKMQVRVQSFFIPISMLRIWLAVVIVMSLADSPWVATIIICLIQGAFLFYLFKYRPLESKIELWCVIAAETLLILAFICALAFLIGFAINFSIDAKNNVGWSLIAINFAVSIVTLLIVARQIVILVIAIWKKGKAYLQKRKLNSSKRTGKVTPIILPQDSLPTQENKPVSVRKIESTLDKIKQAKRLLRNRANMANDRKEEEVQINDKAKVEVLQKPSLKIVTESKGIWLNLPHETNYNETKLTLSPDSLVTINVASKIISSGTSKTNFEDFNFLDNQSAADNGADREEKSSGKVDRRLFEKTKALLGTDISLTRKSGSGNFRNFFFQIPQDKFKADTEDSVLGRSENFSQYSPFGDLALLGSVRESSLGRTDLSRRQSENNSPLNPPSDIEDNKLVFDRSTSEKKPSLILRERKKRLYTIFEKKIHAQTSANLNEESKE